MAGVSDSPERLANPEREGPVQGETLPKMNTFLGNRLKAEERSSWSRSPEFSTLVRGKLDVDSSLHIEKSFNMQNYNNDAVLEDPCSILTVCLFIAKIYHHGYKK